MTPVEPPPTTFLFPDVDAFVDDDDGEELVARGGDLQPGTLVAAYRLGLFPMPVRGELTWWYPRRRGIIVLDDFHVPRSLRKACARFETRVDTAFDDVVAACAAVDRPHPWISSEVRAAYGELHRLGWAHSVESFTPDGRLVGGLYGVTVGSVFAGESMFHHESDASKVALVALVERLRAGGGTFIDTQWSTPHLASLGVIEVSRREYAARLADALSRPPVWLAPG